MPGVMPDAPPHVARVTATAHRIPTPVPEGDGTLAWDSTTIVLVEAHADGLTGLGWTYADASVVDVVDGMLAPAVVGRAAADVPACWHAMQRQVRNLGRPGLVSCAMSAVDIALWDLARVRLARKTVGDGTELFVDANGGYSVGQACRVAADLAEADVRWFEEPVSSDDLAGLRRVRSASAADVAAGEYGYDLVYFVRMIEAEAVDCVQVDLTRCGGFTEWSRIAALAAAHNLEVSAHCAPNISAHAALATPNFRHLEWFVDHHRIESAFFDGVLDPVGGDGATVHGGHRARHAAAARRDVPAPRSLAIFVACSTSSLPVG